MSRTARRIIEVAIEIGIAAFAAFDVVRAGAALSRGDITEAVGHGIAAAVTVLLLALFHDFRGEQGHSCRCCPEPGPCVATIEGFSEVPMVCVLRHGHVGAHETADGGAWIGIAQHQDGDQ